MKKLLSILLICAPLLGCSQPHSRIPTNQDRGTPDLAATELPATQQEPSDKPVEDPVSIREESRVDGAFQKAFIQCYEAFKNEELVPADLRRLENYSIRFRQRASYYYVVFYAKYPPGKPRRPGGSTELGVDIIYVVRKSDLKIVQKGRFR